MYHEVVDEGIAGGVVPQDSGGRKSRIPNILAWTTFGVGLVLLALFTLPELALAQGDVDEGAPRFASPTLPPDHWAYGAVRRLEIAGLAPAGFGGGERPRTRREVAYLLERAELLARGRAPELVGLAGAYRLRFLEEFGWTMGAILGGAPEGRLEAIDAQLRLGYEEHKGEVLTGIGYDSENDWTGARPYPDREGRAGHLSFALALPPHLALSITPTYRDKWDLDEVELTATAGAFGFWVGRRTIALHQGAGGGIVLSGNQHFDGGGLYLIDPVELPWLLSHLGPVRLEFILSQIENGDRIESPWFGAVRGSFYPHPRVELGVNRANIFGGKGNSPTTFKSVMEMILGIHAGERGEYNNEVFSADIRYRPPLGSLPLSVYLEWGMDDSAGGWWYVPARVIGVEVAALPLVPEVSLGIERTSFAEGCCGNTVWYRNWALRGGWAADGRPLGHTLGGHGVEWLVHGRADLFSARARVGFQLFTRDRGDENLFAPEREGKSKGVRLSIDGSLSGALGLFLYGLIEDGQDGWRESAVRIGLQARF